MSFLVLTLPNKVQWKKKEKKTEVISAESVEKMLDSLKQTMEMNSKEVETSTVDFDKIKESVKNVEGTSVETVIMIVSTLTLMLPIPAMIEVYKMCQHTIKTKVFSGFVNMMEEGAETK